MTETELTTEIVGEQAEALADVLARRGEQPPQLAALEEEEEGEE